MFLSCIGIRCGSFTGPSALCNTGSWFKLDCCTNATSISVCASSTAHSSSQSRSEQRASYSVWVALAGCYTFFNILQCSNDKCKGAVRIWVVIAGNFTMLAMLASIYFICVDCMNGRPKKSSRGGVAKGNLWPFDFMTAQICGIPKITSSKHVKTLLFTRRKSRMHSNVETQSFLNCDMIKMSTYFACVQVLTVQKCKCEIETRWNPLSMSSRNLSQTPHVDLPPSSPQVDWQTCQVQSVAGRPRQQHSKTLSEIPSFRVQITRSSSTSKSTPLVIGPCYAQQAGIPTLVAGYRSVTLGVRNYGNSFGHSWMISLGANWPLQ